MENSKKFYLATALLAGAAFMSRVLGLLRNTLLLSFYGATGEEGLADCYMASFKLPDIIFNLVAFGAISIVLIPFFSGLIKKDQIEKLNKSCSSFLNFFFLMILAFNVIGFICAPFFVKDVLVKGWYSPSEVSAAKFEEQALAKTTEKEQAFLLSVYTKNSSNNRYYLTSGADKKIRNSVQKILRRVSFDENNFKLTIKMTRILLFQVLFMTLSGIFGSFLNAHERYAAYSLAIFSYNVGIIMGILFLAPFIGIEGAAWGAVAGSFIHFAIQCTGSILCGFSFTFTLPKFNREIKELVLIAVPRVIAISGEQLVKFGIVFLASFIYTGSIVIFESAESFSMVPYGMIAVSISTTSFPIFSKYFAAGEFDAMLASFLDKIKHLLFLMLPVTMLMIILRREIITLLLGYGKFNAHDILLTSRSLALYMLGIPFFSVTIVAAKYLYAQKKSLLPMTATLLSMAITLAACWYFAGPLGAAGLSLGRSAGYIMQSLMLILFIIYYTSKEPGCTKVPAGQLAGIAKIVIINLLILTAGLLTYPYLHFFKNLRIEALVKGVVIAAPLGLIYLALSQVLGIFNVKKLVLKVVKR